jgi:hypothetical protein
MFLDHIQFGGDIDSKCMPTACSWVLWVEVVPGIFTGTRAPFDDVFVVVADDDGKVSVSFDASLTNAFDSTSPPGSVYTENLRYDARSELACVA